MSFPDVDGNASASLLATNDEGLEILIVGRQPIRLGLEFGDAAAGPGGLRLEDGMVRLEQSIPTFHFSDLIPQPGVLCAEAVILFLQLIELACDTIQLGVPHVAVVVPPTSPRVSAHVTSFAGMKPRCHTLEWLRRDSNPQHLSF